MEQHAIPQHLASFQFKLFGSLTAKQFITLAIPMGIATLIFFSNVAVIVRIPLTIIFGLFGAFAALVPIGGRPFEKWIVAFVRAIFAPTQRIWIKEKNMPQFLDVVINPVVQEETVPEQITIQSRERVLAYLRSLPRDNDTPLDIREQRAIRELNLTTKGAGEGKLPPPIIWPTVSPVGATVEIGEENKAPVAWTQARVKTGDIEKEAAFEEAQIELAVNEPREEQGVTQVTKEPKVPNVKEPFIAPSISKSAKPYVLVGIEDRLREKAKPFDESPLESSRGKQGKPLEIYRVAKTHLATEANFSLENIFPVVGRNNQVRLMRGIGNTRVRKLHFAPPENFDLSKLPIRGEGRFEISDELARRFHFEEDSPAVVLPIGTQSNVGSVQIQIPIKAQEATKVLPKQAKGTVNKKPATTENTESRNEGTEGENENTQKTDESKFSMSNTKRVNEVPNLQQRAQIIPLTSVPNVISGLVADMGGSPLAGAVLVVRDSNGMPIRALKTNKLGQFLSATPLGNGVYTIEVESESAKFQPSRINLIGDIVQPLALLGEAIN